MIKYIQLLLLLIISEIAISQTLQPLPLGNSKTEVIVTGRLSPVNFTLPITDTIHEIAISYPGSICFKTSDKVVYFSNGTYWQALSTKDLYIDDFFSIRKGTLADSLLVRQIPKSLIFVKSDSTLGTSGNLTYDNNADSFHLNTFVYFTKLIDTSDKILAIEANTGKLIKKNSALGYDEYLVILNQSDTNDPTTTHIIKNQIGNIVWTRISTGVFNGYLENSFSISNTIVEIGTTNSYFKYAWVFDESNIRIETYGIEPGGTQAPIDDALLNTWISIKKYN